MNRLSSKPLLITLSIIAMVAYSFIVYAAAPTGGYTSGQTLNPNCAPGDTDCEVRQPWEMNTADGYVYNTAEKIGIGTNTPTHTITIDGDMYLDTTLGGVEMLFDIGDTSVYGGDVGFARFVGNGLDEIGFDLLDYNNGDPLYQISLSNGTNNVSWGLSSISGAVSLSALDVNFGSVETFFGNSLGSNEANISADANTATASILGQDADSGAVIFAQADKAGIIYNTISSDLDGAGTPLVMAVFDENERGGGYSARGRNPNYPVAGADMYVWDPALGGDRTYLYLTEESINTSLMLDPVIVGARNNTINDIDEISFEFHNGDPTIANNSVYKINADFTWSKPATLGDIMTLNGATGALSVSGNTASSYAATFFNDGNNTNRYGVKIQAGADNCSSTGTCDFIDFFDGDGTAAGGVRIVNGTVGTYNPSDMRLKTNIQNTSLAGLSTINALRVTDFQRTSGGILGPIQTGFIAQEVQQVYPAMVAATPDGYLAISEGMLIPVLVKAVQELDVKMKRVETFADSYNASLLDHLKTWLADAGNGITLIAANVFKSQKVETEQLCVGSTCVTEAQLQQLLNQNQIAPQPAPEPQESPSDENIDSQGDPQGAPQDVPAQEEVVPQPEPTPEPVSEAPAQDPIPQE